MPASTTHRARRQDRPRSRPQNIGVLLSKTIEDANALMLAEIDLAKAELRESKDQLRRGVTLLTVFGVVALAGLLLLLQAVALGLATVLPLWAAHLSVAVATLAAGGVTARSALRRFQEVDPAPQMAIENTKEDVECIKETIARPSLASSATSNAVAPS